MSHDSIYEFLWSKTEPGWQGTWKQRAWSAPLSLHFSAPLWIPPWLRRVMVPSAPLRLPLPDISTWEKYVPVCLVTSQTSRFGSLPSDTLWCFPLKKREKSLPSIINIPPPFRFSAWGGRRMGGVSPLSSTKPTAPRWLTWHQEAQYARCTFEFSLTR